MRLWRARLLVARGAGEFATAGGTRLAAAIAYYGLLSLVPLFLALVSAANLVLGSGDARDDVIDHVVDNLPLSADGVEDAREILLAAGDGTGTVGLVSLAGLLWTASGMMGAIRTGITRVTSSRRPRPFLLGKLIDLAMVVLTGALLLTSAGLTVTMRVAGEEVSGLLGIPGVEALAGIAAPILLAFLTLSLLLRFVPAEPLAWPGAWRGAAAGAVALWAATTGFAFYVENFGRYNVVYGSLGAVVVFLLFAYIAALILLLAAAVAGAWSEVAEMDHPPPDDPYRAPWPVRVRRALRRLVLPRR